MSFKESPGLSRLTESKSRRAVPASPPDFTQLPKSAADIPDKTEYLREELSFSTLSPSAVEDYLLDYQTERKKCIVHFDELRPIYDFCWEMMLRWPDSREQGMITYPLYQVLIVAFFAFCSRENDCDGAADYWRKHNAFFQALFPNFPSPLHNISTSRVSCCINIVGPENMHAMFKDIFAKTVLRQAEQIDYTAGFAHGLVSPALSEVQPKQPLMTVGGDGQTAEGSMRPGLYTRSCKGTEIASLFNCTDNVTLDYVISEKKNQEASAFVTMFERLEVMHGGAIFTCDALNSTPGVSAALLRLNAHYLLPIKSNAGNKALLEELTKAFEAASYTDAPTELKPRKFAVGPNHGRYEEVTVEILPAAALADASVNKHAQTQCLIRKQKLAYRLCKREPINEADAKRRENSLKHGADKPVVTTHYYICSLPYCADSFNQIVLSLDSYWRGVEAAHGKLDRYATKQDQIIGCCNVNYIQNRIGYNKIILNFLSYARQEYTRRKYAAIIRRKPDAAKQPVSYARVMGIFAAKPLEAALMFCRYWTALHENPDDVKQTEPKRQLRII